MIVHPVKDTNLAEKRGRLIKNIDPGHGPWYVACAAEEGVQKFSESLRKVAPYLNIGGVFAGCLLIGVFLGHWLDGKWGTEPWMLLTGSLLGIVSGFYHFFKVVFGLQQGQQGQERGDDESTDTED